MADTRERGGSEDTKSIDVYAESEIGSLLDALVFVESDVSSRSGAVRMVLDEVAESSFSPDDICGSVCGDCHIQSYVSEETAAWVESVRADLGDDRSTSSTVAGLLDYYLRELASEHVLVLASEAKD